MGRKEENDTAWCNKGKTPIRELLAPSEGVIDVEAVVEAVVREAVLSGVTGAEAIGGERRAPPPLNEGAFGMCVGEVTPFRRRGVLFTGLRERGVELVLANKHQLHFRRATITTYWKL